MGHLWEKVGHRVVRLIVLPHFLSSLYVLTGLDMNKFLPHWTVSHGESFLSEVAAILVVRKQSNKASVSMPVKIRAFQKQI